MMPNIIVSFRKVNKVNYQIGAIRVVLPPSASDREYLLASGTDVLM